MKIILKIAAATFMFVMLLMITSCVFKKQDKSPGEAAAAVEISPDLSAKKILYIDSYDENYAPGNAQRAGFFRKIGPTKAQVQVFYMDTKNRDKDTEIRAAVKECLETGKKYRPDLIIAADDAACKEIIAPYYAGGRIPVVFIGVNWDAKSCSYPAPNLTGQLEVEFVKEMLEQLKKFSKKPGIALLTADTLTDRKSVEYYTGTLKINFTEKVFVKDFVSWKKAYKKLQKKNGAVFFRNCAGIDNWDDEKAKGFIMKETAVPTGTVSAHMPRFVLIGYSKDNTEFGEYAADTAIKILAAGIKPADIPLTSNSRVSIKLNMTLAKKLGMIFPAELVDEAGFVEEELK